MADLPANPNINPRRYSPRLFRLLEIVPGLCAWSGLLLPFLLARPFPHLVTLAIVLFDVFWLQRSIDFSIHLLGGYRQMSRNLKLDWQAQLDGSLALQQAGNLEVIDWRELYQVVIFTTYREEEAILDSSIRSVAQATYPKERKIMVIATEGRDAENARRIAGSLRQKYGEQFAHFIITEHPDGIVGEVKGKGANATWAAHELTRFIQSKDIPLDRVIVSTADSDCRFHPNYFQCVSYLYATTPDRVHALYQPIPTYLNNIWEAPSVSRILALQTTFFMMATSMREHRLISYSTHAMSLQTLVDMDYWCTSVVNEDSRQYFRAYFRYHGHFRSIPLFMPVYMDAVHVGSFRQTLRNLYLQQQRWAYGVEHFPYIVLESARQKSVPLLDRLVLVWRAWNNAFFWATQSFFITIVGWLPIVLNESFRNQLVATNFPVVTKALLTLTWIGIVVANLISLRMLPNRPGVHRVKQNLQLIPMSLMWVLMPVTSIFFGAVTGIDAQTRLMFGRYLGFRVTEKKAV